MKLFISMMFIMVISFCVFGYFIYTKTNEFNANCKQQNEEYVKYQKEYAKYLKLFKEKYKKCYLIEVRGYGCTKYSVRTRFFYATEYSIDKSGVLTLKNNGKTVVICNQYIIEETTPEIYVEKNFKALKLEFEKGEKND